MKRPALALTLLFAALPLLAQVSAEVPISPPQLMNAADHEQLNPDVATNGNLFLVVWQNRVPSGEIYAARVSAGGALLEQTLIPIVVAPRRGERPRVVWTGELFMVLWTNVGEIRATKISAEGQVVGEELIGGGLDPSMSCAATRCLMVWGIGFGGFGFGPGMSRVAARLFDTHGNQLPELAALPPFTGALPTPRSAASGSGFLVTWQQFNPNESPKVKLYSAAVSLDGRVDNVQVIATENNALKQHAVASDGSSYFVTWALFTGSLNRIEGVKIDGAGNPTGGTKVLDSSGFVGSMVNLVRVSGGYLVFITLSSDLRDELFAFRITAEGGVLDPAPVLLTTGLDLEISAAANGTKVLLVVRRTVAPTGKPDIYAALVDGESRTMQEPFVVSRSAAAQVSPALASDGERVVAVWSESSPAPSQIRTAAFLPNGLPTDAQTIQSSALDQINPAIAFNGRDFLVAWSEGSPAKIMAKRLDRLGEPVERSEIVLSSNGCPSLGSSVAVASDGGDFVVAWQQCSSSHQLFAAQITDGGVSAPRLVAESSSLLELRGLAWGGERYLVTWVQLKPVDLPICDINCISPRLLATRLNRATEVLDATPLTLPGFVELPAFSPLVWEGAYFVSLSWVGATIYATRVSPSGEVLAPVVIARTQRTPSSLAVTSDGSSLGLTWAEPGSSGFGDIWMSRTGSEVPSWPPFPVAGSADDELAPSVAAVGPGTFALAYQRVAHEPAYGSANRVFVRIVNGCAAPKIDSISPDKEIVAGKLTTLTVSATGATAIQWYLGAAGTTTTPLPATASIGVTPSVTTAYWVRVSNACGYTDSATITVTVKPCQTPAITAQPRDAVVTAGKSAELSVAATGTALTYQWYEGVAFDFTHPVANGNGPSLTTRSIAAATQFWVRVTGQCGIVDSIVVKVSVAGKRRAVGQESNLVSEATVSQLSPAVATDGQTVMTVWSQASSTSRQLVTAAFSPNGSSGEQRAIHPSQADQVLPAIAFNGSEYLVVWDETPHNAGTSYVMTKRLDRSGEPVDGSERVLSSGGCVNGNVVVGSDGRDFVVAWQDCLTGSRRLFATRISDGTAGAPLLVATRQGPLDPGGIAWSGEHYLLTWLAIIPNGGICDPGSCDSTRVEAMAIGRAVDAIYFSPLPLSSYGLHGLPRVVWDGAQFAVFWKGLSRDPLIWAARVSLSGTVTAQPFFFMAGTPYDAFLAATFDGKSIVVSWAEAPGTSVIRDIWMARVRFDTAAPWSAFRVTDSADDEQLPAVIGLRPGVVALAYQRANRVFVQTVAAAARRRAIAD